MSGWGIGGSNEKSSACEVKECTILASCRVGDCFYCYRHARENSLNTNSSFSIRKEVHGW